VASVNELVVREFFELHGFLVSQPRKYNTSGRHKTAEEEADFVVVNLINKVNKLPEGIIWNVEDLRTISKAVVGVRGWHTERFYVSKLEQTPEILRFAETSSVQSASRLLGDTSSVARILCLPRLPASGELKQKTMDMLKQKGIDGILSFQTILLNLVSQVDRNKNYEKSDVLQVIRLLKCYDFVKEAQMELFPGRRRKA
jgi:hypothetical protein